MSKKIKSGSAPLLTKLLHEIHQAPSTRQGLIEQLEHGLGNRCVLLYFTSFTQPVIIDHEDVDMIENILQKSDLTNGLTMVLSSPGGSGLAAESIINVCRAYSKNNFEVIVPKRAKSAATMICFGAQRIWMSVTSELGAIDPQVLHGNKFMPAHAIVGSYESLFSKAVKTKGNAAPYLQQLTRYDASEIAQLKSTQRLSESIAITALRTGMFKNLKDGAIKKKIQPFIDPDFTNSHGRRLGMDVARSCGLAIEEIDLNDDNWSLVWELYERANWYVRSNACQTGGDKKPSFHVAERRNRGGR